MLVTVCFIQVIDAWLDRYKPLLTVQNIRAIWESLQVSHLGMPGAWQDQGPDF